MDSIDSDLWVAWLESEQGLKVPLRGYCRLGRAADNHIVIDGHKASRYHAAIHAQDEGEFWLLDTGSRNGTFLNDHRLMRPTPLHDGARITLAGATFLFRQPVGKEKQRDEPAPNVTVTEFKQQMTWLLMADMKNFTKKVIETADHAAMEELAKSVGSWLSEGQRTVEKWQGRIPKFLGDGFLACWEPAGKLTDSVVGALHDFHEMLKGDTVEFRVVLHYGMVTFGGATTFGEETMFGSEINYIFRLEKVAGTLETAFCLSSAAQAALAGKLRTKEIGGQHELKGFPGLHRCFEIDWGQ